MGHETGHRDASRSAIEKRRLDVGFLPITCATPLIAADALGFFSRNGLDVRLRKANSWAVVRDWTIAGEVDAAHMLAPMPLAAAAGAGPVGKPCLIPVIENVNGQAITLSQAHRGLERIEQMRGFRLGVPFDYSIHNYLLRHLLADAGLDPERDVEMKVIPPGELVDSLRTGRIDGFLAADPFNQLAVHEGVGFILMLSKEIWDGHPCCALTVPRSFAEAHPGTYAALVRSILEATAWVARAEHRPEVAEIAARPEYLDQPAEVVRQVLTGRYEDGRGGRHDEPDRIAFDPYPWHSAAIWILTQMKRWHHVSPDLNVERVAHETCMAGDCDHLLGELGLPRRNATKQTHRILGRDFDAEAADAYLASLPSPLSARVRPDGVFPGRC